MATLPPDSSRTNVGHSLDADTAVAPEATGENQTRPTASAGPPASEASGSRAVGRQSNAAGSPVVGLDDTTGPAGVIPVKLGEFGWPQEVEVPIAVVERQSSVSRSPRREPRPPSFATVERRPYWHLPPINISFDYVDQRVKYALGLAFALAVLAGSGAIFGAVLLPQLNASESSSSTPSNSTNPFNSTDMPDPSSDSSQSEGIHASSFAAILFIIVLFAELFYLFNRIQVLYIFYRKRQLAKPSASLPTTSSSAPNPPYTPSGVYLIVERLLHIPAWKLDPSPCAAANSRHRSLPADRVLRSDGEPDEEPDERAIARAQQTGAAPMYNSPEMRQNAVLLAGRKARGPSARRYSWRSMRESIMGVGRPVVADEADGEEGQVVVEMAEAEGWRTTITSPTRRPESFTSASGAASPWPGSVPPSPSSIRSAPLRSSTPASPMRSQPFTPTLASIGAPPSPLRRTSTATRRTSWGPAGVEAARGE